MVAMSEIISAYLYDKNGDIIYIYILYIYNYIDRYIYIYIYLFTHVLIDRDQLNPTRWE